MRGIVFIIGFLSLVVVAGCSHRVAPSIITKTIIKDSVITRTVTRDSVVKVPGEKVTITRYIHCDSAGKPVPFKIKGSKAKVKVTAELDSTGRLAITGSCDSLELKLQLRDKEIYRYRREHTTENKTVVVTEYKTRSIDIFCRWFSGLILLLLLVLIILYKLDNR